MTEAMQWFDPRDERFDWFNVADWEPNADGVQPVRVTKAWRDRWPERTARRAKSSAGMALRFRTDSRKLVFRASFVDVPDTPAATPGAAWERSRPNFFSLYRNGNYVASMSALTHFEQQEVVIFDDREIAGNAEVQVLLPFYYRNSEIIFYAVGLDATAKLDRWAPDMRPRVFFHGDSITQGHGVISPRETYVWQVAEQLSCVALNFGFGGTAWADNIVAQTIASRDDWDVLTIMLGTNSFAGTDSNGKAETAAQYTAKYDAFLTTVRAAAPTKPILCITPILNRADLERGGNHNGERPEAYRAGIARVVRQRQGADKNLHLADGLAMVNDPLFLLVSDRVHPNDARHASYSQRC